MKNFVGSYTDLEQLRKKLEIAVHYLQRIVDCPLGNGQIKDYRTLAAAREAIASAALAQIGKTK